MVEAKSKTQLPIEEFSVSQRRIVYAALENGDIDAVLETQERIRKRLGTPLAQSIMLSLLDKAGVRPDSSGW